MFEAPNARQTAACGGHQRPRHPVQDRAAKAIEETYGPGRVDEPTNQTESRAVAISLHELLSGALAGGMAIAHELPS